ncbi:MAG: chorismate-binding protein, partial [Candidatus Muiribacteriota bacterium]
WFDIKNFNIKIIETSAVIYIYKNKTIIKTGNNELSIKQNFKKTLDELYKTKLPENLPLFILLFYELGATLNEAFKIDENTLLGYVIIPESFIYENFIYAQKNSKNTPLKNDCSKKCNPKKIEIKYPEKKNYFEKIESIKKLIKSGFTYQINYTERFFINNFISPYNLYSVINKNKSRFQAIIPLFNGQYLISDSPERLFSITDHKIKAEPVKGTLSSEIINAEKKLLESEKDLQELAMITDLLRNDICGIINKNSLEVKFPEIMKIPGIIHLYSVINGKINKKKNFSQILTSLFPGGSITGVPKIETMKIINKLEKYPRRFYTGSLGIILNNNVDFNILIRSYFWDREKYIYGAGGGITYWSEAEKEWEEMLLKTEKIKNLETKVTV